MINSTKSYVYTSGRMKVKSSLAAATYAKKTMLQKELGMTLVELMVAMAISLFMLVAIALVYQSSKTGFVYANNTVRMSEDASFAIDTLSRDIRMASYGGCAGLSTGRTAGPDGIAFTADDVLSDATLPTTTSTPKLANVTGLTGTFDKPNPGSNLPLTETNAVMGFPSGTGAAAIAARNALHTTTPTYTVSSNSPILYIAGGSSRGFQIASAGVAAGQPNLTFAAVPHVGPQITQDDFMMIADCKGSELFRVTSFVKSTGILASSTNFLNSYSPDALVMPLETSSYFIATRSNANTPSLYRRFFTGKTATYEEVVPNVEAITYHFGENNTNFTTGPMTGAPTYRADIYHADAASVTNWSRIVSIRIGLIMVTEDRSQTAGTQAATMPWLGTGTNGATPYTVPDTTDGRLRRAYTTMVSIRNRAGL
jgi:type IV pilus assembly protein PilW